MFDMLSATIMMTSGFLMMVFPQSAEKTGLTIVLAGIILREMYGVSYEPDDGLDTSISRLNTIH